MSKLLTFFSLTLLLASCAPMTGMPVAPMTSAALQAQSSRVVYHVVPNSSESQWQVRLRNNPVPVSVHPTKALAVNAARVEAKQHALSQVIVHKKNGQIEQEFTYGNDPKDIPG